MPYFGLKHLTMQNVLSNPFRRSELSTREDGSERSVKGGNAAVPGICGRKNRNVTRNSSSRSLSGGFRAR